MMSLYVQDVMVEDVVTIEPDYTVKYAAKIMTYFNISSLVVHSKDEIVGILTERDMVKSIVAMGQDPDKVIVGDIMSKQVIVVSPMSLLEDAIDIMFKNRIKKLPVVIKEENRSRLIGMLSITDVARLQPQMIENRKELIDRHARGIFELVTIKGKKGAKTVRAKLDTGADRTSVDSELASEVGLSPLADTIKVRSAVGDNSVTRELVEAEIIIDQQHFRLTVSVDDRSRMNYAVLIGRDLLEQSNFLINPRKNQDE